MNASVMTVRILAITAFAVMAGFLSSCDGGSNTKPMSYATVRSLLFLDVEGIGSVPLPYGSSVSVPFGTAFFIGVRDEYLQNGGEFEIQFRQRSYEPGEVVVLAEGGESSINIVLKWTDPDGRPATAREGFGLKTSKSPFYTPTDATVKYWQYDVQRTGPDTTRIHAKVTVDVSRLSGNLTTEDLGLVDFNASNAHFSVVSSNLQGGMHSQASRFIVSHPDSDIDYREPGSGTYELLSYSEKLTVDGVILEWLVDVDHATCGPPVWLFLGGILRLNGIDKDGVPAGSKSIRVVGTTAKLWPWSKHRVRYSQDYPAGVAGSFDLMELTGEVSVGSDSLADPDLFETSRDSFAPEYDS
jgi:hypothetical protein